MVEFTQDEQKPITWVQEPALQKVFSAIEDMGGQARLVGGAVRDSLCGKPPIFKDGVSQADFDIATDLIPQDTIAALKKVGIKTIPTGIDHGTITALCSGATLEITSLRSDVATDGRHAEVIFGTDWNEDWQRRDFTINAIYLNRHGEFFDPAGGIEHLRAKRVVFIGDAEQRIQEDYLRILRFFRFSARYADALDENGKRACEKHKCGLQSISAERKQVELFKILSGPKVFQTVEQMASLDILSEIYLPADNLEYFKSVVLALEALERFPNALILISALWSWREGMKQKMRLSNDQASFLNFLSKARKTPTPTNLNEAKVLLYHWGEEIFQAQCVFWYADGQPLLQQIGDELRDWTIPVSPFSGDILIEKGIERGQLFGAILKKAEAIWVSRDFPAANQEHDRILTEAITAVQGA